MNENNKSSPRETVDEFVWRFGEVEFDEAKWELRNRGEPVELEPRPLEILSVLLRHAGEVVTKDELLEAVWPGVIVVEKALTNAIGKLRKALDDEAQTLIETVHRVGYRLVAPVTRRLVSRRLVPKLDLKPGESVPRRQQWKLLRSLDVSVRSEVWLAEHEKTREKRVFKFSPDGARLSALKREATLSRVLHDTLGERPDFIRVLEWNFAEAPYFIECEYGGQNWLEWAEAQGGLQAVPLEQRLALFLQAAEAVAAAHGAGVLHKDLKPANLLIEPSKDGRWQVHVTDFGSGRLAEPGKLAELGITQMGFTQTQSLASDSLTGTLMYLAPEVLAGQPATQASDVFALGMLLYQIVVGDFKRAIMPGWEREIEDELLREDIAAAANGSPGSRTTTAAELLNSLRTHNERLSQREALRHAQVRALELEREADRYQARRPWLIGAITILFVGIVITSILLLLANRARQSARQELAISNQMLNFLRKDFLNSANISNAGATGVTVADALTKAAENLDVRFADSPVIAAELHELTAEALANLERNADAVRHFDSAAAAFEKSGPQYGVDAIMMYLSAINIRRRLGSFDVPAEVDALNPKIEQLTEGKNIAIISAAAIKTKYFVYQAGDTKAALASSELGMQALSAMEKSGEVITDRWKNDLRAMKRTRVDALRDVGRLDEAVTLARALLKDWQKDYSLDDTPTLAAQMSLGYALLGQPDKNLDEAEAIYRHVVERYEDAYKLDTNKVPGNLVEAYEKLGDIAIYRKNWDDAIKAYTKSNDLLIELRGKDFPDVINTAVDIAVANWDAGRLTEARTWITKADHLANAPKLPKKYRATVDAYELAIEMETDLRRVSATADRLASYDELHQIDPQSNWILKQAIVTRCLGGDMVDTQALSELNRSVDGVAYKRLNATCM